MFTAQQARSKARWVSQYVKGAYGIQIIEDFDSGSAWVRFRNSCGNERTISNLEEFIAYRDTEGQ